MYAAGQVVGRIHDVPSVAELMERIVQEAMEVKEKLNKLL
jgi:enoyl-[acyl-carrier protein] reductase II